MAKRAAEGGGAPPSALDRFSDVVDAWAATRPAVFLDYDGTLTPIVARPDLAVLDPAARAVLERLAGLCPLAVVSGRDLDDVAAMVGLDGLVYAGSHGFDMRGPGWTRRFGEEHLGALDAAEADLRSRLGGVPGVLVERKRFAIAVHTRLADPADKPAVARAVRESGAAHAGLRVTGGKEIHELRPDIPWDKGRAVLAVLDAPDLDGAVPLYIGDDETDEDAFRALAGRGVGIRVMERPAPTAAAWSLRDTGEVARFLDRLAARLSTA